MQNIEKIFLILAMFFGLIFVFINPPFQSPDEPEHLFKMYGYTQGVFRHQVLNGSAGLYMPESFLKLKNMYAHLPFNYYSSTSLTVLKYTSTIKLNPDKTIFFAHNPTGYLPVSYFPVFLWLKILLLLKTPPLIIIYLMRLFELFMYTGLIWLAIRITPIKKVLFAVSALLPMALYMGCSINTDTIVIGLSFVLIAYFFKLAYDKNIEKINFKQICIISAIIFYITLCKLAYIPLVLLFFVIPKKKFNDLMTYFGYFAFVLFAAISAYTSFVIYGTINFGSGLTISNSVETPGTSSILVHITLHPVYYIKMLSKSLLILYKDILSCFIGRFGWLDTFLPQYLVKFYWGVILAAAFIKDEQEQGENITLKDKFVFFVIFYASYLLIALSGFLIFKQLTPYVLGVQGRYFVPIAPAVLSIFSCLRFKVNNLYLCKFVLITSIIGLSVSVYFLILRFYMTSYVQLWY